MLGNGHNESTTDKNFYRIGEVCRLTETKPFVLRYWETEFPMLQPVKSPKGHRLYRREDVETVLRIKQLLYDEGFTIAGARRHLREEGDPPAAPADSWPTAEDGQETETSATESLASEGLATEGTLTEGTLFAEGQPATEGRPRAEHRAPAPAMISRKVLLDLRDSLRTFLTLLESE
jgi:DNA-binding transcriptional MerR regulator